MKYEYILLLLRKRQKMVEKLASLTSYFLAAWPFHIDEFLLGICTRNFPTVLALYK